MRSAENQEAAASLGRSPDLIATVNWAAGAGLAGARRHPRRADHRTVGQPGAVAAHPRARRRAGRRVHVVPADPARRRAHRRHGSRAHRTNANWLPDLFKQPGWSKSVPFIIIIGALVFRGRSLPLRSQVLDRMPRLGSGRIRWPVIAVALVVHVGRDQPPRPAVRLRRVPRQLGQLADHHLRRRHDLPLPRRCHRLHRAALARAVRARGRGRVRRVAGRVGRRSPGDVRASVASVSVSRSCSGSLCAIPVGVLVGLPALRTRGVNLAIATLGLALLIERVVLGNPDYTGGFAGTVVKPPSIFGISLDPISHPGRYATFCMVMFTIAALAVANLRRGRAGRRLVAVRDERAGGGLARHRRRRGEALRVRALGGNCRARRHPARVPQPDGAVRAVQRVRIDPGRGGHRARRHRLHRRRHLRRRDLGGRGRSRTRRASSSVPTISTSSLRPASS